MRKTTPRWDLLLMTLALAGCWETSVTAAADETALRLLAEARSENYMEASQNWMRAPYFETRRSSMSPHGPNVDLWVTRAVVEAFENNSDAPDWPVGSFAIKHGYDQDENITLRALIKKEESGWFFAVLTADDQIMHSGSPELCVSCHGGQNSVFRFIDFPQ